MSGSPATPQLVIYNLSSPTAAYITHYSIPSTNFIDQACLAVNFGGYLFIVTGTLFGLDRAMIRVGPPTGSARHSRGRMLRSH